MSSISPINVRIASKTRFFETTGDSSYYYSSQLISNMALLKAVTKLGQQLGWPSKALENAPKTKQGSAFLAKASQPVVNSRMEPLINLKATPAREWISANLKLVDKLTTSQQFFNSKAIGFLAKGLGQSGKFDSILQQKHSIDSVKTKQLLKKDSWFTSFNYLAQLAKYCKSKHYKQPLSRYSTSYKAASGRLGGKPPSISRKVFNTSLPKISITNLLRKESRQAFKTPTGLSFYLTALGLIGHSQVLKTSLVIAPIISGSLRSNLLLADHKEIVKTASSNGIGLVSTSPKCYISRSTKETFLNFFSKIPAKLAEKKINKRLAFALSRKEKEYQQVYILADIQGLQKPQKRLKPTYASVRWF
uniref:Uncharacterized protein n=1 Tax=Tupiella akineta TaxID=160070 RepID=Q6UVW1_TUPAK|nr:hypothetical protein PsakpMp05 [Tupiella akineta]AAQ18714.1 hypothetical protein [Tupiella akineta]